MIERADLDFRRLLAIFMKYVWDLNVRSVLCIRCFSQKQEQNNQGPIVFWQRIRGF